MEICLLLSEGRLQRLAQDRHLTAHLCRGRKEERCSRRRPPRRQQLGGLAEFKGSTPLCRNTKGEGIKQGVTHVEKPATFSSGVNDDS
ncbi:hypothetical protein EYF80_011912 [Liparis tanakae]|uniref:Uncharacterized protein n=1 Tax=Liparis tanakae TaxID=230148 RepID=A0A4Z2IJ91_9TELE|nr:hypothetical protein EYF80_011912 [Liparis tanakae]